MTYRLAIRAHARSDMRSARNWYEEQTPGLGIRFGDELDVVILSIGQQPLIYPFIYRDVRRAMTRHFPYSVYFVVKGHRVAVLRVLHHARDPREWPA